MQKNKKIKLNIIHTLSNGEKKAKWTGRGQPSNVADSNIVTEMLSPLTWKQERLSSVKLHSLHSAVRRLKLYLVMRFFLTCYLLIHALKRRQLLQRLLKKTYHFTQLKVYTSRSRWPRGLKAWECVDSFDRIVGSNPAEGTNVRLLSVSRVIR
jgi:hypothetical protein